MLNAIGDEEHFLRRHINSNDTKSMRSFRFFLKLFHVTEINESNELFTQLGLDQDALRELE